MKKRFVTLLFLTIYMTSLVLLPQAKAQEQSSALSVPDVWSEESQLTFGSGQDYWPSIARDSTGKLWLTFVSTLTGKWGLLITNSSNNGVNWATPRLLVEESASTYGLYIQRMSLIVDSVGRIWLAWMSDRSPSGGSSMIWYMTSDDGGVTWSNPKKPYEGDAPWSGYSDPSIIEAFGKMWIFFGHNGQILSVSSSDGGNTWSTVGEVTSRPQDIETQGAFPGTATLLNNELWLVYSKRLSAPEHDIYLIKTTDGVTWSSEQRITGLSGFEVQPAIIDYSGKLYVFFIYSNTTTIPPSSIQYTCSTDGGISWTDYRTLAPDILGGVGDSQVSPVVVDKALWAVYSNKYKIRYRISANLSNENGGTFQLVVNAFTIAASIIAISLATAVFLRKRNRHQSTVPSTN